MFSVTIDDDASAELREAAVEYELQQKGLGREFLHEAMVTRRAIAERPRRFPKVPGVSGDLEIRRALCDRVPVSLVFQLLSEHEVRIIAVPYAGREPLYWLHRVEQTEER